jgi:hypothetical protein
MTVRNHSHAATCAAVTRLAAITLAVAATLVAALLVVPVLVVPTPAQAEGQNPLVQPQVPVEAFRWPGEEFYFSVRLNGAEAMRASLRAGDLRRVNNRSYVPISAVARSVGFFQGVYPIHDRANTFVDPIDFRPLRSEKLFEERGEKRSYKVDYTHSTYRAKVEKMKEKRTFRFNYSIPGTTHDMISWMYDLRSRESLKKGTEFTYYIYDGWKLSRVEMKVLGKEDVYTPMGWFKTWKISFGREVLKSHRQKGDNGKPIKPLLRVKTPDKHAGHLYLSRDENRLPVKVAIGTKFGTSEALLIKYKPHERD